MLQKQINKIFKIKWLNYSNKIMEIYLILIILMKKFQKAIQIKLLL